MAPSPDKRAQTRCRGRGTKNNFGGWQLQQADYEEDSGNAKCPTSALVLGIEREWCPGAEFLRSLVRIHPLATDEIGHGGNDAIRLLNDHEMPGARDIDDLHPLAELILKCMSVTGRGDYVVETLDR